MSVPEGELEWLETNLLGSFCLACVDRTLRVPRTGARDALSPFFLTNRNEA